MKQIANTRTISEAVESIFREIPEDVELVAAAKSRSRREIDATIRAGVKIIGHNYIQEAERMLLDAGKMVKWHFIGHLQTNKAKKAAVLFDMVETVDSVRVAEALDRHCKSLCKILPVLIEVNSGRESSKSGVLPEQLDNITRKISILPNLRIRGLMTMGPHFGNPENARPFFRATREAFERLAGMKIPGVEMQILSMGMSNSYKVAIEEGANLIRIGSRIFGERNND